MNQRSLATRTEKQLAVRADIDQLEKSIRNEINAGNMEQTIFDGGSKKGDRQCGHYFGENVYARSLLIPAGTAVVGKIHKQDRICIIAQGECVFADEFHSGRVAAPWIGEFKAGTKTCVFAFTDTLWIACLGTDKTDSRTAFDALTLSSFDEYLDYLKREKIPCPSVQ